MLVPLLSGDWKVASLSNDGCLNFAAGSYYTDLYHFGEWWKMKICFQNTCHIFIRLAEQTDQGNLLFRSQKCSLNPTHLIEIISKTKAKVKPHLEIPFLWLQQILLQISEWEQPGASLSSSLIPRPAAGRLTTSGGRAQKSPKKHRGGTGEDRGEDRRGPRLGPGRPGRSGVGPANRIWIVGISHFLRSVHPKIWFLKRGHLFCFFEDSIIQLIKSFLEKHTNMIWGYLLEMRRTLAKFRLEKSGSIFI